MNNDILEIKDLDMEKIKYSQPRNYEKDENVKIIDIKYNNEKPLIIQTNKMYVIDDIVNKDNYFELIATLKSINLKKTLETKKFFEKLEKKIIKDIKKFKNIWFDELDKSIKYKSIKRLVKNNNYNYKDGIMKVKILDNCNFMTTLYDENKNKINIEELKNCNDNGYFIKMIVELSGIWIKKNVCGIKYDVHQIKKYSENIPLTSLEEYSFKESDDKNEYQESINTEMEENENVSINDYTNIDNCYEEFYEST